MYTTYFVDGIGIAEENVAICEKVGQHMGMQTLDIVHAADHNMSPRELHNSGVASAAGTRVVAPEFGTVTFSMAGKSSLIDFFWVSHSLSRAVKKVYAREDVPEWMPMAGGYVTFLMTEVWLTLWLQLRIGLNTPV